jgi:sugar O-acyltransferase (sialic acid O-acetyltransferase NeuD family)
MNQLGLLLVFGAGGHGKVVADVATSAGWELSGFLDDGPRLDGTKIWGLEIFSLERLRRERPQLVGAAVALGVGDNRARERAHGRLVAAGLRVVSVLHATAAVAPTAILGEGTVVMANASVNPDARLGRGCIVNTGAVVEHDCQLADYVHLSPNAALGGAVILGSRTHIGLGAVALPGIKIGSDVRVGAGAAVICDAGDAMTLVGVPARPVKNERTSQ